MKGACGRNIIATLELANWSGFVDFVASGWAVLCMLLIPGWRATEELSL